MVYCTVNVYICLTSCRVAEGRCGRNHDTGCALNETQQKITRIEKTYFLRGSKRRGNRFAQCQHYTDHKTKSLEASSSKRRTRPDTIYRDHHNHAILSGLPLEHCLRASGGSLERLLVSSSSFLGATRRPGVSGRGISRRTVFLASWRRSNGIVGCNPTFSTIYLVD